MSSSAPGHPKMLTFGPSLWYLECVQQEFDKVSGQPRRSAAALSADRRGNPPSRREGRLAEPGEVFEETLGRRSCVDGGKRAVLKPFASSFGTFLFASAWLDLFSLRIAARAAVEGSSFDLFTKCDFLRNLSTAWSDPKHSANKQRLKANGGESQHEGLATFDTRS